MHHYLMSLKAKLLVIHMLEVKCLLHLRSFDVTVFPVPESLNDMCGGNSLCYAAFTTRVLGMKPS